MAAATALEVRVTQSFDRPHIGHFASILRDVAKLLDEIDHTISPEQRSRPDWVVEDLRHEAGSFHVRVTASGAFKRDRESLLLPAQALISGVQSLRADPELPRFYTADTVATLLKVAAPDKGVDEVALATANGVVNQYEAIDGDVRRNARAAVRGADVSIGSVTGTVTRLNRGKSTVQVTVLDPVTRRHIPGTAPAELIEDLRHSWARRVTLRGRIKRNSVGQVLGITVSAVERLPDQPQRTRVAAQIFGADPGWINGETTEAFLDRARRRA